mgnify:CR=1 FL=1
MKDVFSTTCRDCFPHSFSFYFFSLSSVSNTTLDRNRLTDGDYKNINGGLSGAPLMVPSTNIVKSIKEAFPKLSIIGVGGVMSKDDFDIKINAGAELVQIYTGFIYNGPKIVQDILN